jgi:hypothetical protein
VVNTIAAVTTSTGLTVTAVLDEHPYPTGLEVTDAQMQDLEDRALTRHGFHGEWNLWPIGHKFHYALGRIM